MKAVLTTLVCYVFFTLCATPALATVYKWKPASGTSAKNKANWRSSCATPGTVFPTASDTIQFDGSCSNTDCVFDTTFNVAKINVKSNYSGSISTSGSITLTFGIGIFEGGTFNGGSVPITFTTIVKIEGTAFTSTSSVLSTYGDFNFKSGSFTHNNGTVVFYRGTETTTTIVGTSNGASTFTLYKAEFAALTQNSQYRIRNITVEIVNELKLTGTYHLLINTNTSSVIEVQGNIISSNTATVGGGDCQLVINGTGSQSITDTHGSSATGKLCNVKVDKSSGTLSLAGNISIGGSTTWEYVDGTISEGTARLICDYNNTLYNNSGGDMKFAKLDMVGDGGTHTIDGKVIVTDTFSTSNTGDCDISGDTLELQGNVVWNNTSSGSNGNVFFKFSGEEEQIVTGESTIQFDKIKLIKSDGNITLENPVSITTDIEFVTGNLISDTVNLVTIKHGATATGASENSFIGGAVKKIGNSSFVFPVGKDTIYNPIAITAPSSSTDAFRAEYFNYTQPHGFDMDSLTFLIDCEYWNLKRTNGSSNVKVTLYWATHSCDIYTLTTLKIGRWNGSEWNNIGAVTTTGSISSGTISTNADQSLFGDYLISKRSPQVVANAGANQTINLGGAVSLGGSPTVTGGVSPYTYNWIPPYSLNNATIANPSASPFLTQTYIVEVTDLDHSIDIDTVIITVDGFDLKSAKRFPLLTNDSLVVDSPISVVGAVGAKIDTSGKINATDTIFINTATSDLAIRHLDTAMQKIDAFTASSLSSTLDGQTIAGGVHRISSNASLNGVLTLEGSTSSFVLIDINGNLNISDESEIVLDGLTWDQVYIRCVNLNITGSAILRGIFLLSGTAIGNISDGDYQILADGKIKGEFNSIHSFRVTLPMNFGSEPRRKIENFFGFNVSNIIQEYGVGSPLWQEKMNEDKLNALHTRHLRFPGGAEANFWRWQSGWFRGYNNPAYKDDIGLSGYKYGDDVPLPLYCQDGTPWDLNSKEWQRNTLVDFRETVLRARSFPIFDINMLSSDAGSEIGGLFYAHCVDLPVKYVELGNEFALSGGEEANKLYPTANNYFQVAHDYSFYIKSFFPDVKIAAVSTTKKGDDIRRNEWNTNLQTFLNDLTTAGCGGGICRPNFDALTFHLYPGLLLDNFDCNLDAIDNTDELRDLSDQIFSTPFLYFDDLDDNESPEEFKILDQMAENGYELEGWITEYNQEEDKHNFHGRWGHGLFTATMALRALENKLITKATCFELLHSANRGVVYLDENGFVTNNKTCNSGTYPASTQWEFGAAGISLRYIGMASQNARSARQLNFGTQVEKIKPKIGPEIPALYGWCFSNSDENSAYSPQDSNWVVILNFDYNDATINTTTLFPNGGDYVKVSESSSNYGRTFVDNPVADLTSQAFIPLTSTITVPAYGLVFIRGGGITQLAPPVVLLSKEGMCINPKNSGNPPHYITAYLSASGADSYEISPGQGVTMITEGPGVMAKIFVVGDGHYEIRSKKGSATSVPVSIDLVSRKYPLIDPTITTAPTCPGTGITIDANPLLGSYAFNWYPTSNLLEDNYKMSTFQDEETVSFNPLEDTYYHLNVTDGYCYCLNEEILADVYDKPDAGPDILICSLATDLPVLLSEVEEYSNSPSILWSEVTASPDLDPDDIAQPTFPTPSEEGSYTYQVTVTYDGCDPLSDEVTVNVVNCCTSIGTNDVVFDPYQEEYFNFNDKTYLTASYLLNPSSPLYSKVTTYNPYCGGSNTENTIKGFPDNIIINGIFHIDVPIAFVECPNLLFGPQARIIIEPNARLAIRQSQLKACGEEMWKGILMEGNLDQDQGLSILTCESDPITTLIADAEFGVFSSKDSRLSISGSDFDKNLHHVWLENYRFALSNKIDQNTFLKSGFLLNVNGLTPILPLHGIYMNDISGFEKLEDNKFYDCHYGIQAVNSGFTTQLNNMDGVYYGIYSIDQQSNISITGDNEILDCNYGIFIQNTGGYKVEIIDNLITTKQAKFGAGIYISDPAEFMDLRIGNETFPNVINANTKHGIYLNGFNGGFVQFNEIHLRNGASGGLLRYGIRGEGISGTGINVNTVDIAGDDPSVEYKRAISLSTTSNCIVNCNLISLTEFGIQFQDDNSIGTLVQGNQLNSHVEGLVMGENDLFFQSTIPDQGNSTLTPGNIFGALISDFDLYSLNSNASFINYTINPINDPIPDAPLTSGSSNIGFEIQIGTATGNPPYYGESDECAEDYSFNEQIDEDFFETIIDGSFPLPDENMELYSFVMKSALYERFHRDFILRNSRIIFSNFYDTIADNNIRKFFLVREYINRSTDTSSSEQKRLRLIDTALAINDLIEPDFDFEENQKIVNNIFMLTLSHHIYSFETEQWDAIADIAFQCPYVSGPSVFIARSLYNLKVDTVDFDDRDLCYIPPKLQGNGGNLPDFNLYPNPTEDIINVNCTTFSCENVKLIISDLAGRHVLEYDFEELESFHTFNAESLPAGIYICSAMNKQHVIWYEKFCKLK